MTNYIQVIKKLHKPTMKNLFYKTGYVLIFCGITGCFVICSNADFCFFGYFKYCKYTIKFHDRRKRKEKKQYVTKT